MTAVVGVGVYVSDLAVISLMAISLLVSGGRRKLSKDNSIEMSVFMSMTLLMSRTRN